MKPTWLIFAVSLGSFGCTKWPDSRFPSGQAALDRMKEVYACSLGVKAAAKLDHKSEQGRIRGNLSFFAIDPARVRFSVFSPFGAELATLTSDGTRFAFTDVAQKKFFEGPASACNIAKLTQVPIPGHALVSLLQGRAPLLVHEPGQVTLGWKGRAGSGGYYIVEIPSKNDALQTVHLEPHPDDIKKPWEQQRVRVRDVKVVQKSVELYHAKLSNFATAKVGEPVLDEDGIDPPLMPIGPACTIEVPKSIDVEVTVNNDDVRFRYEEVTVNPAVPEGVFVQPQPGGTLRVPIGECQGW